MSEKQPPLRVDKAHKDAMHFIPELDRNPEIEPETEKPCNEVVREAFQKVKNFDRLSNAHTELPLELRVHVNESWETLTCIIYRLKRKGVEGEHDVPIYIYQSDGAGGNNSKPALSDALMEALVEDILEEWRLLESDTIEDLVHKFNTLLHSTIVCHQRDGRISKATSVQRIFTFA